MRNTITIAVAISSLLLGAVGVAAEPETAPVTSQAAAATSETEVGSPKSNVDEKSSSGAYYPNSAGTVGDDPAHPKSTAVTADTDVSASGPRDKWGKLDSDGDGKVTESECRAWYESDETKESTASKAKDNIASSSTPSDKTGN